MKVLLFGATGMVGQGVLRECLADPAVDRVVAIGRTGTGQRNPKLVELIHRDLTDYSAIESELGGFDACFFCLGISSTGLTEDQYRRVTHDIAVAAGTALLRQSPSLTFVFVSGSGADSTESGRIMWARIKGKTENALLAMPFKRVFILRPGVIQPLHGIKSRTRSYRVLYAVTAPILPILKALFPGVVTTTEQIGRAMLVLARTGDHRTILTNRDLNSLVDAR